MMGFLVLYTYLDYINLRDHPLIDALLFTYGASFIFMEEGVLK